MLVSFTLEKLASVLVLDLRHCSNITDAGLDLLHGLLSWFLDLSYCDGWRIKASKGFLSLARRSRMCKSVYLNADLETWLKGMFQ